MGDAMTTVPQLVLAAYGASAAVVRPLGAGLINQTFLVEHPPGARFVLQCLHPVFGATVNDDIDAVTRHLAGQGLVTPRLLPTLAGGNWVEHEGAVWRALTWVEGVSLDRIEHRDQAREAGRMLARFHRGVSDLPHKFCHVRPSVHDTPRHLAKLRAALDRHRDHARFAAVEPLARRILEAAARLETLPARPLRIVHGDPKLNNFLFTPDRSRALCLIDLDTLGYMPLVLELGDAFRSWCNTAGEDNARAGFSLEFFAAGIEGYAEQSAGFITEEEWKGIVAGTLTIYVELAARFCADALEESYFGWNPQTYATRGEHNQVRAESQLNAAQSLIEQRAEAEGLVRRVFAGRRLV